MSTIAICAVQLDHADLMKQSLRKYNIDFTTKEFSGSDVNNGQSTTGVKFFIDFNMKIAFKELVWPDYKTRKTLQDVMKMGEYGAKFKHINPDEC